MRTDNYARQQYNRACQVMPGGVNSPVRAFQSVGGIPPFIQCAEGAYLLDSDGNRYIDYVGSWGAGILGHAAEEVVTAITAAAKKGVSFGAPTEHETEFAELLRTALPSLQCVRLMSSGSEATMTAVRLVRGYTHRPYIIKFAGGYHGHSDSLLADAGSGVAQLAGSTSSGLLNETQQYTLTAKYNDLNSVDALYHTHGDQIAAIIVEPIAGNMSCVPPLPDFLPSLRKRCDQHGSLLIFDEVMTGFRVDYGGAQTLYDITPDLTTLGKAIGGGLPLAALGGRRDIMTHLAPLGQVYQAGTLSGNPLAVAAGIASLKSLASDGFYQRLTKNTQHLVNEISHIARTENIPVHCQSVGGMFGLFFGVSEPITNYSQACATDKTLFTTFFHAMLNEGIYFAPSPLEAGFLSRAHSAKEIDATLAAVCKIFPTLRR